MTALSAQLPFPGRKLFKTPHMSAYRFRDATSTRISDDRYGPIPAVTAVRPMPALGSKPPFAAFAALTGTYNVTYGPLQPIAINSGCHAVAEGSGHWCIAQHLRAMNGTSADKQPCNLISRRAKVGDSFVSVCLASQARQNSDIPISADYLQIDGHSRDGLVLPGEHHNLRGVY